MQGWYHIHIHIVNFYCTTIRTVLEYRAPVFHHALPAYLNEDIERIQKRALSIISPVMSYWEQNLLLFKVRIELRRQGSLFILMNRNFLIIFQVNWRTLSQL